MDNALKKRLELIKARAKRLGSYYRSHRLREGEFAHGSGRGISGPGGHLFSHGGMMPEDGEAQALLDAAPGEEVVTPAGKCYIIRTRAEDFDASASREAARLKKAFSAGRSLEQVFGKQMRSQGKAVQTAGLCFFDIETAGLTPSTYVFLTGVMMLGEEGLVVEQIFARDYSEEKALLLRLREQLTRFKGVITYNGISFDIPFIRTRMAVNRVDFEEEFTTLDLLGPARRSFSAVLPNCKLETVRQHLTGVERVGDIPGSEVPYVYHEFVRTGDARKMKGVIYHNRMDLLAMVTILNTLS